MTSEQRAFVFEVGNEIQMEPGGMDFQIYASISIVRIQYLRKDKHFQMMVVGEHDTKDDIRKTMMKLYKRLKKSIEVDEKNRK